MSRADSELWTTKMTMSFQGIDSDGDGVITAADLDAFEERLAQGFGHTPGTPEYERSEAAGKAWTANLMDSLDKSGDDQISLEEWLAFFSDASDADMAAWCDQWAAGVCALGDADDDGQLSKSEYIAFALASGASQDVAEAGFAALDSDGSGYVSRDEFARFMLEYTTATEDAPGNQLLGAAS